MTVYAKLTSKGQITLPVSLRNAWNLKPGDQIAFDVEGETRAVIAPRRRRSILEDIEHLTIKTDRKLNQQDIDDAVEEAIIERFERSRNGSR